MIYTLTVNPSLDYVVDVEDFSVGCVNRCFSENMIAGGKGLNVSMVLSGLGIDNVAFGFSGGFTGKEILRQMEEKKVTCNFIQLEKGNSRINVKLRSGKETEINAGGPEISEKNVESLFENLNVLKDGDILILAGSIPKSLNQNFYSSIMNHLSSKKILYVVDATKNLLKDSLKYHPFLIKPNNHELGEIFGVKLETRSQVIPYAKKMQEMGAENVLVSLAGEGAVLAAADGKIYESSAPEIKVVNSVGAGDSMVAGFLAGWIKFNDYGSALKWGIAAGSASASMEGLCNSETIKNILEK